MSVLKQIFEKYAEDSITDEQVQRILAPVLQMIRDGKFDRRRRFTWQAKLLISALTAVLILAVVVFAGEWMGPDGAVVLPDNKTPLASQPLSEPEPASLTGTAATESAAETETETASATATESAADTETKTETEKGTASEATSEKG